MRKRTTHQREEQDVSDTTAETYYQRTQSFRAENELFNLKIHRETETRKDDWLLRPVKPPLSAVYFHAVPYLMRENYVLTFQVGEGETPESVGRVLGYQVEGFTELDIGTAKAWVYPEQKLALLWECYLYQDFRVGQRQIALWRAFEGLLLEELPVREISTPGWDPAFEPGVFQTLLQELGYEPLEGTRFWRKAVKG